MNVNINNFVISQLSGKITKGNYSTNMNKGIFANMLNNAMTENQSMEFLGDDFNNLLINTDNFIEDCVDVEVFEDNELQNQISYENISLLADIFLLIPNLVKNEVIAEDKALNVNYDVFENELLAKGYINSSISQEKLKIDSLISQTNIAGKLISEIEGNMEASKIIIDSEKKPQIEAESGKLKNEHVELAIANSALEQNKIITISDESTQISSQVLTQVKDKIIIMTEDQDLNGIKTITMQLQPQNLGKVDIKLIYENNKLTVEIKAFNEETQEILSSNTSELKDLLSKTSGSDIKIIMKPYEFDLKHQPLHNNQNAEQSNEQNFYQNNEQNHEQQGRQRNKYYYDNVKQNEEDVFSELIDLSEFKTREGRNGN